ncbi:MAG: GIY-YIG nuclease family protein [Candidatus Edwardsbacteria bacterium]
MSQTTSGKFYVGSTENIKERIFRHNAGWIPSTCFRGPWKLVYKESYPDRSLACKRESQIKKWKSRKAIQELINRGVEQSGSSSGP